MRWERGRRSENVEDRRGMTVGRGGLVGGGIGTVIIVLIVSYFLGVDPTPLLQQVAVDSTQGTGEPAPIPEPGADPQVDFVSMVLADTEDTWDAIFTQAGSRYEVPKLVLFSGAVQSACGFAQAAMGPFYCPSDGKVYIDLDFFRELSERFRAPGDFAQAYVIAHEIGHHVQNLMGTASRVRQMREAASEEESNALSVRAELQADCYSGVWAHHADRARHVLEEGDVEEALAAATAIGDDRLQQQSRGYVTPDSFTHGSSEQRVRWFRIGLESGDLLSCETFSAPRL
jgi:predicted metalloprotease